MSRPRLLALLVLTSCAVLGAAQNPPAAGRGVVVGRVVDTKGEGAAAAHILIHCDGSVAYYSRHVIADEHGDFAFTGIPPAGCQLSASKPGYLGGRFGQTRPNGPSRTIELAAGERRLDVSITMPKLSVITGTVTDETGAPRIGISVSAVRPAVRGGSPAFESAGGDMTDERGEYRITNLEPGLYAIAIHDSWRVLTLPDPRGEGLQQFVHSATTYPARALDLDPQDLIRIGPAQELSGIDLRVGLVPAVQLSGTVTGASGDGRTSVRLRTPGAMEYGLKSSMTARPDGSFTFDGVTPGRWVVDVVRTPPDQSMDRGNWSATVSVAVGATDVTDLNLVLRPGPMLSGRLEFDGRSTRPGLPEIKQTIHIEVSAADGRWYGTEPQVTFTSADAFTVTGLVPGRYIVRPITFAGDWSLRHALIDGRDVSVVPFDLAAGGTAEVAVTFTDQPSSMRGVVRGGSGDVESDAMIVAFPTDPRLWSDYGREPRRLPEASTDRNGVFALSVAPGEYFVAAIRGDIGKLWRQRRMLTRLSAVADRVTFREGDRLTVDLRLAAVR